MCGDCKTQPRKQIGKPDADCYDLQKTVRWLLVPMLALGLALVVGYAVQIWYLRRRAALERRSEDKVAVLEKAD